MRMLVVGGPRDRSSSAVVGWRGLELQPTRSQFDLLVRYDWHTPRMLPQVHRRRVAAFAEAGEISRELAERAFSNEVITPGKTSLADVAWWMREQQFENNLGTSFGMPSVYITGPDGFVALSNDHVIQRGDFLAIDWGVGYLNFYTDVKRHAYVLREGETELPASIQKAFDNGRAVRDIIKATIKPGRTAGETFDQAQGTMDRRLNRALDEILDRVIAYFTSDATRL